MDKSVVILSGGLDSTVLLAALRERYPETQMHTLTFNYGSKHNAQENAAALTVARYYGVPWELVELPFIDRLFASDLLRSGGEIPEGHYEDASMKRTVVPFRNGIMLAIAAGYAESIGGTHIYFGAHKGDHAIYPDCRIAFTRTMHEAIVTGTYAQIQLAAPFSRMTKTDIVIEGARLRVPFELTYSCYKGGKEHCGKCGTCRERREAFIYAQITDPTIYTKE